MLEPIVFEKKILLTITIDNKGFSLTMVNETTKKGCFWENDRHATLLNVVLHEDKQL